MCTVLEEDEGLLSPVDAADPFWLWLWADLAEVFLLKCPNLNNGAKELFFFVATLDPPALPLFAAFLEGAWLEEAEPRRDDTEPEN